MVKTLKQRLMRLIAWLNQQPIFTFEWQVLKRQTPVVGKWTRRFNLLLAWWTLLMSIVLYLNELIRAALGSDLNIVPYDTRWWMGIYALLALVFYTTPHRRGQMLAQQIIGRDKSRRENWELILLTGVDARTYVLGKWWLLMRSLLPTLLLTGIVRAGAVTFLVAEFTRSLAAASQRGGANVMVYPPSAVDILLVGVLSLLFTYIQLPGTAARYVESALDSRRNGNTAMGAFLRTMVTIGVGIAVIFWVIGFMGVQGRIYNDPNLTLFLGMFLFTILDNGFVLTIQLAAFTYLNTRYQSFEMMLALEAGQVALVALLILPVTAGITAFWLKMAEWTAQRYELVPAPEITRRAVERRADAATHREAIR